MASWIRFIGAQPRALLRTEGTTAERRQVPLRVLRPAACAQAARSQSAVGYAPGLAFASPPVAYPQAVMCTLVSRKGKEEGETKWKNRPPTIATGHPQTGLQPARFQSAKPGQRTLRHI